VHDDRKHQHQIMEQWPAIPNRLVQALNRCALASSHLPPTSLTFTTTAAYSAMQANACRRVCNPCQLPLASAPRSTANRMAASQQRSSRLRSANHNQRQPGRVQRVSIPHMGGAFIITQSGETYVGRRAYASHAPPRPHPPSTVSEHRSSSSRCEMYTPHWTARSMASCSSCCAC